MRRDPHNPDLYYACLENGLYVSWEVARLGYMLQGNDDAPTAAILEQKALLDPKYQAAIQAYDDFLTTSVATFNQAMTAHNLTGVVAGAILTP